MSTAINLIIENLSYKKLIFIFYHETAYYFDNYKGNLHNVLVKKFLSKRVRLNE